MEEQNSIFQSNLSPESNNLIFSAGKWSKFLGILFFVCAGIFLLVTIGLAFSWDQFSDSMALALASNPQAAMFQNLPQAAFIILMVVLLGFFIFIGLMFYKVGQHSADYYASNEEGAFISTFQSAKKLFLVYAIFTIISVVFSLIGMITQLA
jgi:preprotein translocase subunit SecG